MRKNISSILADKALIQWLLRQLEKDPPEGTGAADLREGLHDLAQGSISSLLLSCDGATEIPDVKEPEALTAGALILYPRSRKVLRDGNPIFLTPKEFDILYFLMRNRGEVFTKEQIYQAVWEDHYLLDDSNIMAFIRKLRKKIEPAPDAPVYIVTIWGIGYMFSEEEKAMKN